MPKKEEKTAGAPEWMCTFSDMMSLLLCFFVLLFSLSTIEKKKMIQASGSLRAAFGGLPAPYITETIPDKHTKEEMSRPAQPERRKFYAKDELVRIEQSKVHAMNLQDVVQVTGTEQGITFRLSGDAFFEVGQYNLTADALRRLQGIAEALINFPSNPIRIAGHTDSSRRADNPETNWMLASRRAFAVLEYFRDYGSAMGQISPDRMSYESFGEFNPIADNEKPIGRAMNRRIDVTLIQTDDGFGTYFDNETVKNPRTPLFKKETPTP